MLLIFFGTPGVGKNFVGKILKHHFDFYFYDGDDDLTDDMKESIKKQELFSEEMRKHFYDILTKRLLDLQKKFEKIVMAQALMKELNRQQILNALPHAEFVLIEAESSLIDQRLRRRNDWVSLEYAEKIRKAFEPATLPHKQIINNKGETEIISQIQRLFPDFKRSA
jgi:gluconate kinase